MDWQDISTAPRDRDFPALYRSEMIIARWSEQLQQFVGVNCKDLMGQQTVHVLVNEWAKEVGATHWLDVRVPFLPIAEQAS